MLAREYCVHAGIKLKPVILSHHMIYGLKAGQAKMSKSDADSAIFMEDTREDIERKISNAFCPIEAKKKTAPSVTEVNEAKGAKGAAKGGSKKPAQAAPVPAAPSNELRLVEDDLENPCLDYVKHIVLSDPTRVFVAGGVTYTRFEDVKADFLAGKLSEQNLKASLIEAVDALVAPVRKHFTENADASALLARIAEYKKEDQSAAAKKAAEKPMRRLSLGLEGKSHVVVAPMPTAHCSLSVLFTLLKQLKLAPSDKQAVLWLPDWSAMVLSSFDGDMKVIKAAYTVLVEAMRAIDLKYGGDGLKNTKVMFQSEAIMNGPSEYWISVINVGRALKVKEVQTGYPSLPLSNTSAAPSGPSKIAVDAAAEEGLGEEEGGVSEPVGCVVAALMFVGDILALAPHSIACQDNDGQVKLALDYWTSSGVSVRNGLVTPTALSSSPVSTWMSKEPPLLPALYSVQAHDDDYFIGDDPKAGANKKMKRAFCEPMNTSMNPPLSIARHVILDLMGSFQAGDKTYSGEGAWGAMKADFEADALSPQLLKPAATTAMAAMLDVINSHLKKQPDAKKAEASIKAWATKKKGGGGGGKKQQQSKKK